METVVNIALCIGIAAASAMGLMITFALGYSLFRIIWRDIERRGVIRRRG